MQTTESVTKSTNFELIVFGWVRRQHGRYPTIFFALGIRANDRAPNENRQLDNSMLTRQMICQTSD